MPYKPNLRQPYPNELYHHGIKGQRWGVRRFQNLDGSYTPAGKKRYSGETGIKGLFNKKKKKKEAEAEAARRRATVEKEASEYANAVEKAGFTKNYEHDNGREKTVSFEKRIPSNKYKDLKIETTYNSYFKREVNDDLRKANRFSRDHEKIIQKAINKVVEENYDWMAETYQRNNPGSLIPSKAEIKKYIKPDSIDASSNVVTLFEDVGFGMFDVDFNPDTYEARVGGYMD